MCYILKMDPASVQWPVPLYTLECGHVFKIGHVSVSDGSNGQWPLDKS